MDNNWKVVKINNKTNNIKEDDNLKFLIMLIQFHKRFPLLLI
jgi:hypothetical protein